MAETQVAINSNDHNDPLCSNLYVLMTKDYRVSRSRRAKWLINHYLSGTTLPSEEYIEEMTVLNTPTSPPVITTPTSVPPAPLINTDVYFLTHHYSIVFVLDMTSTMLQVSNETFCIKLDEATRALYTLLEQIIQPMHFPGASINISPQLCVTILVYSGDTNPQKRVKVLVQGVDLNKDTINDIINIIKTNIHRLNNKKGQSFMNNTFNTDGASRADNCLERMIKAGLLGVQLLPRGSMKGLVVLTDGIGGFATPTSMHNAVNQLRTANISCWVVLCGGGTSPSLSLGSIPDTQTIAFVTEACNGCVIDPSKLQASSSTNNTLSINDIQRCILLWTLHVSTWRDRTDSLASFVCQTDTDPFVSLSLYTQHRNTLILPLNTLIGCRTREGFFIQSISIQDNQVEIVLTYPWQPNIFINYSIRASFPVTMASCSLLVTLSFIAPYPFVRDFQSDPRMLSVSHSSALRRFKQTLKSLTHSDTFLSHSIVFSTNPQFYTLPKNVNSVTPLFYNQPNQSKPVPITATQGVNDKSLLVLCKYWTPLCSLDINIWPKWLHTDKIVLILSQDSALPPHLLYPSSSGRYSNLQCRVAALKLFNCIRLWCTIVLLENLLFLKFLPTDINPLYYCAIRVAQMQSCVSLHVGFIEGTPRKLQLEILSDLNNKIDNLTISLPLKDQQRPFKGKKKPPRPPQQPCTTLIKKQLQKALISYDLPLDTAGDGGDVPIQLEYHNHYEWQWGVPHQDPDLLMGLLQERLKEGFLIASASNGIVTLVAQIEVKQPSSTLLLPSLIQYVIFPYSQKGVFSCEIWVEPQYIVVSDTPLGLEYLKNEKTVDIPYKIHSKDIQTLTQITTFLEYSPKTPPIVMPVIGTNEPEITTPPLLINLISKPITQDIQSDLSSLYSKSHVTALTFSAFTEKTFIGQLTLDNCSLYNRLLNTEFQELWQQRLSADIILVREPIKLMNRLQESRPLQSFVKLYANQLSSRLLWKCCIINDIDGLILLFTPCFINCTSSQDTPTEDTHPDVFSFPLVIMHTTLPHLLGEDSLVGGVLPLPPDEHYNCMFNSPEETKPVLAFNRGLFEKIKRIHNSAYLHSLQKGLSQGRPLTANNDLLQGLSICTKAELSVNLTPLLLGVCHHCTINGEDKVTLATISSLLETLDDQRHNTHSISYQSVSCSCSQREREVSYLVNEFLLEKGINRIEGCGYYWYKEERKELREPSVCSTDDEIGSIISDSDNNDNTNEFSDSELSNLELIFTPPPESIISRRRVIDHYNHAPLFICLRTVISSSECQDKELLIQDTFNKDGVASLCLNSLFSSKPIDGPQWTITLVIQVYSLLEQQDITELEDKSDPLFSIHSCFRPLVTSLQSKVEWLIKDELVSRASELFTNDVPPSSLLPSVTSHIQGSVKKTTNCSMTQQPVSFVLGHNSTSAQFIQFISSMTLHGLTIHSNDNNYFYFKTKQQPRPSQTTPPILDNRRAVTRSTTPTLLPKQLEFTKHHRRSVSLTSDLSSSSSVQFPFIPRNSIGSSIGSPLEEVTDSMYDASNSNSSTSIVTTLTTPPLTTPPCTDLLEVKFWLVLRVVPRQVELYLHSRCSQNISDEEKEKQAELCSSVIGAIRNACHKTNQWYLLKDLLDTHKCSPLLLSESLSAAWVAETAKGTKDITVDGESFTTCQFECMLQWRKHVTPHWRLKSMGNKVSLNITNNALEAFAVSNRQDVFVLQDVLEDGNETIFYLKVSESVFFGNDGCFKNESSPFDDQRSDTKATTVEEDTVSTLSYQRSSFDVTETPHLSHQMSSSVFSLNSGTHESIVLELYGITKPSEPMRTRLKRLIQFKLDDKALEMMCSSFTRNQRLELSNADIQFLQEYPEKPSEVLSIPIPYWVSNPCALFYYILQQFSAVFTKPVYNTTNDGPFDRLCVPPVVDRVLREYNLPLSIQQDLLSLYIRPMIRGRGIALISASLVSPEGDIVPLTLDILQTTILHNVPTFEEIFNIDIIEEFPCKGDNYTIALHIWERGNVGMDELRGKLTSCVQYGVIDLLMEVHYLQLPVASLIKEEIDRLVSPGLLRRTNTISNRSSSLSDGTISNDQREIEMAVKGPVIMQPDSQGANWEEQEKQRREQICRDGLKQNAYMGQRGTMKQSYFLSLSSFLTDSYKLGVPEIFHHVWQVPANYLISTTLSQILAVLSSSLASLLSTTELSFSIFQSLPNSPDYVSVEKTTVNHYDNGRYIILGRDLGQWRESMNPRDSDVRNNHYWPNEQQYVPLSSWKQPEERGVLLIAATKKHDTFIPRQRMILGYLADGRFQLWLYNIIDDRVKEIKTRLTSLESWQLKRSGFLYHILSQKLGLFHHTGAKDISPLAIRATRHCKNINNVSTLIEHTGPVSVLKSSSSRGHDGPQVELDRFYQDQEPPSPLTHPPNSDPITRHGLQFKDTYKSQRELLIQSDLFFKVFNTWDNPDRRNKIDQATPISSEIITKLKRTSRLLHYCSSSIWLLSKSYVGGLPDMTNKGVDGTEDTTCCSETCWSEDTSCWFNCICEQFIAEYVSYLQTLNFQSINERPSSKPPKGQSTPQHSTTKYNKCLQRSWTGGIILIELSFESQLFLVKLYSLELSRSTTLPPPSQDVSGLFSQECSRIKDFIHTHSFNYDFHIRSIHRIILGRLKVEGELDLRNLLNEFCANYVNPPQYIRNRLCSDSINMSVSVPSRTLYTHILGHCSDYNLQTVDIIQTSGDGCGSSLAWDNCLMIDLRPGVIGTVTTPELSQVLRETKDVYNVIVLALPDINGGEEPVAMELPLKIYMLLVNRVDIYPRLTIDSPIVSSSNRKLAGISLPEDRQSQLHDSVKFHRRKLGYGSLGSPSSVADMVFNPHLLKELMNGLEAHFKNIIRSAQNHVRRNELWKKLLYGGMSSEMPVLNYAGFQELLQLVTLSNLEHYDTMLGNLVQQTKKWYQRLLEFLQFRYGDSCKSFTNDNSIDRYAVIINQGWHDMFIMVESTSHQQGFYTVYRKPHEGGTPFDERKITSNIEAEQFHINDFVNCVLSFLWADIINHTQSLSPKIRHSKEK